MLIPSPFPYICWVSYYFQHRLLNFLAFVDLDHIVQWTGEHSLYAFVFHGLAFQKKKSVKHKVFHYYTDMQTLSSSLTISVLTDSLKP